MSETSTDSVNAESEGQKLVAPSPRVLYWLVPDDNGKPARTSFIPIFEGQTLNHVIGPIMPLYDLKTAAALVPIGDRGLTALLHRHKAKFLPRYRTIKNSSGRCKIRLLSSAEIVRIREIVVSGKGRYDLS